MSETVIRVENLSKQFLIGAPQPKYDTLRDRIVEGAASVFRRNGRREPVDSNIIWALKDVSFEVKRGEVLGIIGRNGAGKSTLLKILACITQPTGGRAQIHGRLGSLLEVGTGFHPELTGRENIYLNGAILGMRKTEITRKFDDIVAFAEVEKFIDTPVKRYSSGMHVRLAFAVAAHLEPEILVIDEVLAVGDIRFQKKCLARMGAVSEGGRTVLFVSHQMNQIRRLCESVAWLESGRIKMIGPTAQVLGAYETAMSFEQQGATERPLTANVSAQFLGWEILDPVPEFANTLSTTGPVTIRFVLRVSKEIRRGHHGIGLYDSDGQLIWGTATDNLSLQPGLREFTYSLPSLPLRPGAYYWRVSLYEGGKLLDRWVCVPELIIATEPLGHSMDQFTGILNFPYGFSVADSVIHDYKKDKCG
jgi:lipopolysaccharide transport system ATP-binding protein